SNRAEDARALRVVAHAVQNHGGVVVEADVRTVVTTVFLVGPHHDCANDVTLLDTGMRLSALDGRDDDITHAAVVALRATQHADHKDLARTTVVGYLEPALLLDHCS